MDCTGILTQNAAARVEEDGF